MYSLDAVLKTLGRAIDETVDHVGAIRVRGDNVVIEPAGRHVTLEEPLAAVHLAIARPLRWAHLEMGTEADMVECCSAAGEGDCSGWCPSTAFVCRRRRCLVLHAWKGGGGRPRMQCPFFF
jgi:hypothetical protein